MLATSLTACGGKSGLSSYDSSTWEEAGPADATLEDRGDIADSGHGDARPIACAAECEPGHTCVEGRCESVVPEVAWARSLGAFLNQAPSLAVDAAGNIYAAGWHDSIADIDLGDGTVAHWSGEIAVNFVISYDPNGRARWLRLLTPLFHINLGRIEDLAVGPGCVALVASFGHSIDLGAGVLTSEGEGDGLVACLDPDTGDTRWNAQVASENQVHMRGVAVDDEGRVAIGGYYGEASLRIGDRVHPAPVGPHSGFFAIFDRDGTPFASSVTEGSRAAHVVAGVHRDFLYAGENSDPDANPPALLIDFAADGGRRWEQPFVRAVDPPLVGTAVVEALALGLDDTFLVGGRAAGVFFGTFEFDATDGDYDDPGFIAEVGPDGTPIDVMEVAWPPTGLGIQADGSRILGGSFVRHADFGGCTMTEDPRGPNRGDGFVVSLDERGRCEWALHLTSYYWDAAGWGHFNTDLVTDLELDPTGAPIFVGVFNQTLEIGAATVTGVPDGIYLAKLRAD